MVAQEGFLGCPPTGKSVCGCGEICCGQHSGTKYIQPLPPKSYKPETEYKRPSTPMDSNTVYKNSFEKFGPRDIKICRMEPFRPVNSLQSSKSKIDEHTITKLSFPEHSETCKRNPILPHNRSLLGTGSMQDYTTQKHDYVAKPTCKRNPIRQETNLKNNNVPLDSDTVQKLSFISPDPKSLSVAKSCKPLYVYKRSDVPMDEATTHKLSYLPVLPQIKEELPWAKKSALPVPDVPFEQCTTYKLSYIPNSGATKLKPLRAKDNQGLVTTAEGFDSHTIYKESFFEPEGCYKRAPILPTLQLHKSDANMNSNSVYKLSYPGHVDVQKCSPIWPHSRYLIGGGPFNDLTTQRRDFVDKPLSRRSPIIPVCQMRTDDYPLDSQTTMKLSFMQPDGLCRSLPIRPKDGITQTDAPMDNSTIQKLSFPPVTPPEKEKYPWMLRKTHNAEAPMDFNTTQNLSFMPPGEMIKIGSGCNCSYPGECMSNKFPKADSF